MGAICGCRPCRSAATAPSACLRLRRPCGSALRALLHRRDVRRVRNIPLLREVLHLDGVRLVPGRLLSIDRRLVPITRPGPSRTRGTQSRHHVPEVLPGLDRLQQEHPIDERVGARLRPASSLEQVLPRRVVHSPATKGLFRAACARTRHWPRPPPQSEGRGREKVWTVKRRLEPGYGGAPRGNCVRHCTNPCSHRLWKTARRIKSWSAK